ncbi:hypothetical protein TrVE_jg11946 [Triparma verrucosa]|uniref:DUF202 domain-containing protein n=1 Tax=Triparma verrucosa TaxID=1606542 RepID=A0A9W7BW66_9STRA|nr:hypothetical protein TrVE_jg11946 [Triparma verrucosa]
MSTKNKVTIKLNLLDRGREQLQAPPINFSFYLGSSSEELEDSLKRALHHTIQSLPSSPSSPSSASASSLDFVLEDPSDGSYVALSSSIPGKTTLNCLVLPPLSPAASTSPPPSLNISSTRRSSLANTNQGFQASIMKFERVNAHLANERTWLAWIRTSISILGCAFSFLTLAEKSDQGMDWFCVGLGIGFVVCVLLTFFTGYTRYRQVKRLLSLSLTDINENFERFGVGHQSRFLLLLLVLTAVLYFVGGAEGLLY